jgi:C1A family cysteine protease
VILIKNYNIVLNKRIPLPRLINTTTFLRPNHTLKTKGQSCLFFIQNARHKDSGAQNPLKKTGRILNSHTSKNKQKLFIMKSNLVSKALQESGAKWKAAENRISELEDQSKRKMLGAVKPAGYSPPKTAMKRQFAAPAALPSSIDWRNNNGNFVTSVKDQGGCGSCVAFGTIAAIESRFAIEQSMLLNFSEADSFFCSNHGANCGGWWPASFCQANQSRGIIQEVLFPYASAFPSDNIWNSPPSCVAVANRANNAFTYANINTVTNLNDAKNYLVTTGPLSACFDVYDDFFSYSSGIYTHVTGDYAGGHCVCIVGYNDADGGYWICKNSWGDLWGMGGYFNIAYGQCNIDVYEKIAVSNITQPLNTYVSIKSNVFPNVFLRMDGTGVTTHVGPGGGKVNCQFGAHSWEQFVLTQQGGGIFTVGSVAFPNVFLRMDGTGVTTHVGPGGGNVNCQFGAYSWEQLLVSKQSTGTYTIGSVAFPNVFLRMDGTGVTTLVGPGGGVVNCQFGAYSWEQFIIGN